MTNISVSPQKVLAEFYSAFGWPGESAPRAVGPAGAPLLSDVSAAPLIAEEVALLRGLLADGARKELVQECRALLWEIAELGSDTKLLEEIERYLHVLRLDRSRLLLGLQLYAQASGVDPAAKKSGQWDPIPKRSLSAGAISLDFARALEKVGATILRLYVAMVYLRGDAMTSALERLDKGSAPRLGRIQRLFSHKLVQHVRNAVAHGHLSPSLGGLHLVDRSFEIVLTPGMIDNLCIWMFLFYYQSVMVMSKAKDG